MKGAPSAHGVPAHLSPEKPGFPCTGGSTHRGRKAWCTHSQPLGTKEPLGRGQCLLSLPGCYLLLRRHLGTWGQASPNPPHTLRPLTSKEPSFMVEPGTVRGMVRLRSPGSGIWRALGVGGGGWKVIP